MSPTEERILIIGGASGIGLACARLLAARGHPVTVASRNPERARATLESDGIRLAALDAGDRSAVEQLFAACAPVAHVIASIAGGVYMGPFASMDAAALERTLDGKLRPCLSIIAAATTGLAPRGSITLITGLSARHAAPMAASLALVNGALESLVLTLAVELAPRRINAVSPGTTSTTAWERMPSEARRAFFEAAGKRTPLGRVGEPEDVARAVAAIIDADFVTGAVLPVDGGAHVA